MPVRRCKQVDVLSDVLRLLEPRSEIACRSRFTAPWGIAFSQMVASFHLVERGACVIHVAGEPPVLAERGDLVVLPRGVPYSMADTAGRRTVPYEGIIGRDARFARNLLDYGGGGAETVMVCGISRIRNPAAVPMLMALPPSIQVRRTNPTARWLDMTTALLLHEAEMTAPGSDITTSRLLDLLFVQAVRVWLDSVPHESIHGWLSALRDPRIGATLTAIHTTPAHAWTVTELAERAGMSRSPFATRFAQLLGEPPLRYLTRWRLLLASRALQHEAPSVREVAASVGYDAEEAFSRAFKRHFGVAPSAYRNATAEIARNARPPTRRRARTLPG